MQVELKNPMNHSKYTKVLHESDFSYNAPHHFEVVKADGQSPHSVEDILCKIDFQEGPINEVGVNGVMNEDLIVMVIRRLEGFQSSEFKCRENAVAITKLEESLMWLGKRTRGREVRGVEGTNAV
jgi:hypothetical protein